jgi:translation initiation factor IF-2
LAKELSVNSSAIIKKCQDEGLDVKNHMSTISAGLAATIHEWFSEGEHSTTIEVAEKVDLEKVRVKRRVKKKPPQPEEEPQEKIEQKPAEIIPPQVQPPQESPRFPAKAGAGVQIQPIVEAPQPAVQIQQKPAQQPAVIQETKPAVKKHEPKPKPEPIKPAGPILEKPKPAKLIGPRVVRIESAEPLEKQKPKHRGKYNETISEPLISEELEEEILGIGKKDKKHIGRHGERTHGRRTDDALQETAKKAKYFTLRRQRDIEERRARLDAAGGERLRLRPVRKIASKTERAQAQAIERPTTATVTEPVTIKGLSAALAVKTSDIISKLLKQGVMATANESISNEAAQLVAIEFGCELAVAQKSLLEDKLKEEFENRPRNNSKSRPIVATMLGHVDHGKTSLLDKIRSTKVAAGEAGGITQHTSAYQAKAGENKVTFLDTPGHEAFTAMRARGANMTDVVVLVVAADDGVMPQTIEAIAHSKAASVPVVIALNKIDLPSIDTNRIYSQLAEHGLAPVEWGGETDVVKTSAVTGQGIDDLLEHIDYVRQVLDLKADDTIPATGWVVEARMSAQYGVTAILLIKEGQIDKGDVILAGTAYGKVKTLKDSFGRSIKQAVSSMPVEITGLNNVPQAGDRFYCLKEDLDRAKTIAEENLARSRESSLAKRQQVTLENLFTQIEAGNVKELNVIIRADVQGSVDVLTKYLSELSTEQVKIKILQALPGGITEGDVVLAEASNGIIIGFNVVADEIVSKIAETKGVDIRLYTIIYRITDDLKKSMVGLLEPEEKEKSIGKAAVRETFKVSKLGTIAGCHVSDGVARKNAKIRLIRDSIILRDDMAIESLKHFKDDVREVKAGMDCGIKIAKFDDIKVGDVLDFYEIVEVARTL